MDETRGSTGKKCSHQRVLHLAMARGYAYCSTCRVGVRSEQIERLYSSSDALPMRVIAYKA